MVFVVIPVARTSVTGSGLKQVNCEECQTEFFYVIKRTATVRSLTHSRADDRAALSNLEEALKTGTEAIPCPECGHYQADMIRDQKGKLRKKVLVPTYILGVAWLPLGLFSLCAFDPGKPSESALTVGWILLGAAILCFLGFLISAATPWIRAAFYQPNNGAKEKRIALAKNVTWRRKEVAHLLDSQLIQ